MQQLQLWIDSLLHSAVADLNVSGQAENQHLSCSSHLLMAVPKYLIVSQDSQLTAVRQGSLMHICGNFQQLHGNVYPPSLQHLYVVRAFT